MNTITNNGRNRALPTKLPRLSATREKARERAAKRGESASGLTQGGTSRNGSIIPNIRLEHERADVLPCYLHGSLAGED